MSETAFDVAFGIVVIAILLIGFIHISKRNNNSMMECLETVCFGGAYPIFITFVYIVIRPFIM